MDDETKKRIAEIRAREQKATPGPWNKGFRSVDNFDRDTSSMTMEWMPNGSDDNQNADDDAEFIANARQDVPFLLDALEKANVEITRLREEVNEICFDEGIPIRYKL